MKFVLRSKLICVESLLILLTITSAAATMTNESRPTINTTLGLVEGKIVRDGLFRENFYFQGIPYAEPPVGDLRFKNPVPKAPWFGVLDATKTGSGCANGGFYGIGASGSEDCLYLNVYAPSLNGKVQVMFWIFGGAFVFGDGGTLVYGPEFLLRENVIVVTFNYRLGALGFLSTGDENAQGNYALKDMVLALTWVKENIAVFGGDPESVTLFGQSAGSGSIHLLMLSEMARGLFHRAIMMSGNAFTPFIIQNDPKTQAEELGRRMGLKFDSTESLVDQLRKANFWDIVKAQKGVMGQQEPLGLRPFEFTACVEPKDSKQPRFLVDDPENLMLAGKFTKIPLMIGDVSREGLLMIRPAQVLRKMLEGYNKNPDYFVPISFNLTKTSAEVKEVAAAFKKIYFAGKDLSSDSLGAYADFHTDAQFKFQTQRLLRLLKQSSDAPIYKYNFSFSGPLNFLKTILFLRGYEGVCHADDIFYLFSPAFPIPMWSSDHAATVRKRFVRLQTNFAKFGNPTPSLDPLIETSWPTYSSTKAEYMDIGAELVVKQKEEEPRLQIWLDFQKKFTGHY